MSLRPTTFPTRFARLSAMLRWLFATVRRIGRLDDASQEVRNAEFAAICRDALDILNVRLDVRNRPSESPRGVLVVSNHVSLLDIFAITAVCPSGFVAMKELERWPLVGRAARNAGAVFIDRGSRKDVGLINGAVIRSLESGQNVCFFPEARTSCGDGILPFKAALFQSALDARVPVQPLALRYFDGLNRRTEQPSFSGVNLLVSMWRIVSMREVRVRVDFLPPFAPEGDRFALKDRVEAAVGAAVGGFADGGGLTEEGL
ncbi:1-acyl-sn-glycerol-3-phosphate acyltransferase [Kingella potus]|uniref:1-acyl-sn-glycerol-3-phosphate acyltransferase n=2 Tax=Kingella potus TaxID=265175 RepID=A0A377R424_9NEIS|nr:1-acyl-sn-glycerol-3-phosphate acyltransferase [Kingella potus]